MTSFSSVDCRSVDSNDAKRDSDKIVTIDKEFGNRRNSETTTETTTLSSCTDTPFTTITTEAVVSIEAPMMRSLAVTPATGTPSELQDVTTAKNAATGDVEEKKAGHHFYYVPPSTTHEFRTDLARNNSTGSDSNDQPQQRQSFQLQQDSTFLVARDQTLTPQFPSSPMVTPPIHKSYFHGTNSRETSVTKIPTSTNENQNIMFHQTTQPQQQQQSLLTVNQHIAGVPHVYHDYISQTSWNENEDETTSTFIRKKTGGVSQPFPEKLHEMLTTVENTNEKDIVTWLPHGRAFIVRKPKEFTDFIMPKYFKQTKLTSFQRQLNLYGFRRLTQGADAGAYYHELFLRVRPSLCQRMARQKVKGTGHKQPADAKTEPNFYEMTSSSSISQQQAPKESSSFTSTEISLPYPPSSNPQSMSGDHERHSSNYLNDSTLRLQPQQLQYDRRNGNAMNTMSVEPSSSHIPADSVLDSPGLQCAAHLLQGIASGYITNNLHIPTSDALTTDGSEKTVKERQRSTNEESGSRRSASFLQPRLSNEYR